MGQALAHGRKKDTITMTRERERGSERRRMRGRERVDGHRDIRRPEPRGTSTGLFCLSMFGRQMTRGLTCDMLSWKTKKTEMRRLSSYCEDKMFWDLMYIYTF